MVGFGGLFRVASYRQDDIYFANQVSHPIFFDTD